MNPNLHDPSDRCDAFAEDLSHFVLGELPDERRPALERHLVDCAACRAERDLLARAVELVKSEGAATSSPVELSPARRSSLLSQAAEGASPPRSSFTILRLAAAAAVVVGAGLTWRTLMTRKVCDTPIEVVDHMANAPTKFTLGHGGVAEAVPPAEEMHLTAADPAAATGDAGDLTLFTAPSALNDESEEIAASPEIDDFSRFAGPPEVVPPLLDPNNNTPPGNPKGPETPGAPSGGTGGFLGGARGESIAPPPASKPAAPTVPMRGTGRRSTSKHGGKAAPSAPAPGPTTGGGGGGGNPASKSAAPAEAELARIGEELRELGYVGDDDAGAGSGLFFDDTSDGAIRGRTEALFEEPAVDSTALAACLASSNAPSDVLALEPQLVAAFRFDPNTPASREEAEASARRSDDLVREFLKQLAPRQGETPRDMFFRYFGDHSFVSTRIDAKSTFGMDADTASYNLVRAYLTQGTLPPKAAVRTEEFVNAFRHDFAPPAPAEDRDHGAEVFAIRTELAPSPFGEEGQLLLQVGLKAREVPKSARRPVALTFVIDVSGSMEEGGRLEMVKRALGLLVDQLDERDTIGIVTFSTDGRRALDPTSVARRGAILSTLDSLRPDGSTNADAGLRLGYDMALEQLRPNAENRVILCSDGVANTGITDVNRMVARIRECKSKYVYLNCVGVGMNNHNDALLEQLADEGDGTCAYVDRDEEAKEIFVDKLSGTLVTVARNAKVQVEFDPQSVRRFRQLGYENRALAHRDFRNDRVDAGEIGAGHEVVALYEIELQPNAVGPLATVRCRYEEPRSAEVIEQAREVFAAESVASAQHASPRFRLTMAVAEFAEILRQSIHARTGSLADVQRFAEPLVDELPGDPDVPEFVALVKQAARLPDLLPRRTELVRAVDEIKRVRCWQEELRRAESLRDPARDAANDDVMRQLEEQNRKLEQALRDALERAARGS